MCKYNIRTELSDVMDHLTVSFIIDFQVPIQSVKIEIFYDPEKGANVPDFLIAFLNDERFFFRGSISFRTFGKYHKPDLCTGRSEFTDRSAHSDNFIVCMSTKNQDFHIVPFHEF
jgi:hypothetical protein